MSTITIGKFTGGLTDFPIGAEQSQYEFADNFIVDEYEKLLTRPGRSLDFTTNNTRAQVATSASTKRISLMCPQKTGTAGNFTALKIVGQSIQYDNGTARAELLGPASNSAFAITGGIDAETAYAYANWNDHTIITHDSPFQKPVKVYRDSAGTLRLRTAGLPTLGSTYTATGGSGANYIYALVVKYTYTVGDVTYIDLSPPTLKEFTNIGSATSSANPGITVGSIPTVSNGAGEHFDTASIIKQIYRTTNNGTVLYLVSEIANATTSYSDTTSDDNLISNEVIYTEGGVVQNDRPPKCKYVHGTSDFVYYANGIEVDSSGNDLDLLPQRVWQSNRGDPDSVPASFFADMESPITGICSVRSIPIVFCENAVYRLDGFFDSLGRGGIIPKKISDSVGAVGHLCLVQTFQGVFFAANDGFYFTDGYNITPLSELFKIRYFDLVDSDLKRARLCGSIDLNQQWVLWATSSSTGEAYDDDNAQVYCFDLRKRCFTTWSSGFQGSVSLQITGTNSSATVTVADTTEINAGDLVYRGEPLSTIKFGSFVDIVTNSTTFTINYAASNVVGATYTFVENTPQNIFFRNFLPTALLFANRTMYMGDVHGYTTYFDKERPSDVWIDPSGITAPASLDILPLYYEYAGPFFSFGTTEARKYVHMILTKAKPRLDINAEMTLQISGENDDNDDPHDLTYIKYERFYPWGTPAIPYGDPRLYRAIRTIIDVKRRFPAGKLRCEYKQVGFVPAFVNLFDSSVYQVATIAAGSSAHLFTVTMATDAWVSEIYNYWISFVTDGYVTDYRIVVRNSDQQITIHDPTGTLTTGVGRAWVVRALVKEALINLIEYSLFFEIIGPSQTPYQGENAIVTP